MLEPEYEKTDVIIKTITGFELAAKIETHPILNQATYEAIFNIYQKYSISLDMGRSADISKIIKEKYWKALFLTLKISNANTIIVVINIFFVFFLTGEWDKKNEVGKNIIDANKL